MLSFEAFEPPILTVTALTSYLRELLETDEILQDVWVRGEISNFSRYSSGHLYFSLKDAEASIRCVMWKNSAMRLKFDPKDGQAVEAHGSMSIYAANGTVQLYIDSMRPVGEGLLYQEFLRLKTSLEAEGLFDPEHKRPIPQLPRHIGIITSASGAALQDMLNTLSRRLPTVQVTLAPTLVQGDEAPAGIVRSIEALNQLPDLDVILVGRGGGSIEDLWAFNNEAVARAIYQSKVPVISGVGHETDFTIADFVADLRAPTPTAAAELATAITKTELIASLQANAESLDRLITQEVSAHRHELEMASLELRRYSPQQRVNNALQHQDDLRERLERALQVQLREKSAHFENARKQLKSLSPLGILARGYAILTDRETGSVINRTRQAKLNQDVEVHLQDGRLSALITKIKPGEIHD